ncbi:MAG: hypothetical protein IKS41_01430 [Alphaproteobacteria bacterium]|nr:hypothetical protein [Alphaproteobacteria bacterium]
MNGFKKVLAMSSFAVMSAAGAAPTPTEPQQMDKVQAVQRFRDIVSGNIINRAGDPTFKLLFQDQLQMMAQTEIGAALLRELPKDVNYVIAEKPEYSREAGFWDGKNCVIYDDTLLSASCFGAGLIAHETRHAIQGYKYGKDYEHMPTEQQIVFSKMMEVEARLQDVLISEELYQKNPSRARSLGATTADWRDYRRLKENIGKENPNLSADQVERMARTQFVIDTWQGNYQKGIYDQRDDARTFKDWTKTYNSGALRNTNGYRCWAQNPYPDTTVDKNLVQRHHEIMQEFIKRMGIDVPPDFFDDLRNDKSLSVIKDPQKLAAIGKHFGKELKMVVMPRDDFVPVGGLVVAKDNSTLMFTPEKRREFEKEIRGITLANQSQQASR